MPEPVARHRPARRHLDAEIAVAVGHDLGLGAVEAGADPARRAPAGGGCGGRCRGAPRLDRVAAGVLPEGPADHEDPLAPSRSRGRAAARRRAGRGRCAPGAPGRGGRRGGALRSEATSLRPPRRRRQRGVDRRDHRRALADRAADALDRARAHVADGEDPGQARLERRLAGGGARHRRAGQHEAGAVERRACRGRPSRSRGRRRRRGRGCGSAVRSRLSPRRGRSRSRSRDACSGSPPSAVTSVSVSSSMFGVALDALDQVARHALAEIRPADQQVHPGGVDREVDRRLAGRVAAADQRHLGARAEPRLHRRGPVPDAAPLEPLDVAGSPAAGSARRWRSPRCAR